ncbi:AMP-binding protein [Kordiimonas pumila]|uniref:AMP-binding protein n=1 Tax=Kordiimonas pumila TaxID=2161677 RepID=A0ABV7D4Z2_9PROT|nr:AMP-binding protein [Kordiimonas pumila]
MANMTDYAAAYASFTPSNAKRYNFARDVIDVWAQPENNKRAMLWIDDTGTELDISFADIAQRSCRVANMLSGAGVRRGDTVIIILSRQLAWWETLTACIRAGFIASPGTTQLSPKDIAYRVDASGATAVVTDSLNAAKVDEIFTACPTLKSRILIDGARDGWVDYTAANAAASTNFTTADTAAEEDALCYFTSGTTGYPKMTMHTHGYGQGHVTTGKFWLDLTKDDLHWNISDTGWAKAAWSSYFAPWIQGAALFTHHTAGFDPKTCLGMFARYPITTMCGAPTIYRMLVQETLAAYTFPHLRHCVGAGEPLNPEIISAWQKATGLKIRDGYGQTETVILCGSFPALDVRPGSMGKPSPGVNLAIIDETGTEVAAGVEGDIALSISPVRPPWLFKGYKGDTDRTEACFRGSWYLTGDRAYRDEDGYFWFVSRADDVILSAGYRIGPFEVESALIEHPAVAESAVVSSPDATRGEIVAAFVVLAPGYTASDDLKQTLKDHVKHVTAPYKYPRKIEFVSELPKTVSGKIRRIDLRNREWGKGS